MAESNISLSIIDCPATSDSPERIDQCPSTPGLLLRIKSPHSTSSAASSDNEQRTAGSPPPNCAICLGKCKNKCFTDSCLHQFCFKCLLEWSKVKAECPLCKQSFTSIIYNVKSIDVFDEYLVRPSQPEIPLQAHLIAPPEFLLRRELFSNNLDIFGNSLDLFLEAPRSTRNTAFSTTVEVHANPFLHRSELIDRFRQRFPNVPANSLGQLWRRYVYERRLHALPVVDSVTGRFRECSARFYRENPAQIHRLMPWLNRDIVTLLLRENDQHVSYVLSVINDLLSIYNINSPEFRQRITPYFRENTSHFIHELINFARSPFDMVGYDREVRYTIFFEEIVLSTASSSSSDSDDVVAYRSESRRLHGNAVDFTIENRDSSVRITVGENNTTSTILTPSANNASTSQITAINLTTSNNSSLSASNVQILGQTPVIQIERTNVVLSSSTSSDECQFVLERKPDERPPHLRTPELVSLNSESDSDVIFVSEIKLEQPINQPPPTVKPQRYLRKRMHVKKVPKGVFMQSGEVDDSSDSDFNVQVKKERKIVEKKSNSSPDSKKIKDEYNYGASTSSGLKNTEKKKVCRTESTIVKRSNNNLLDNTEVDKKRYAKHNLSNKCSKSIYEDTTSSSSSSSSSSTSSSSSSSDESDSSNNSTSSSSNIFDSFFAKTTSSSSSTDLEVDTKKKNSSLLKSKKIKTIDKNNKRQCSENSKKKKLRKTRKRCASKVQVNKKNNKIKQRYKKRSTPKNPSSGTSIFGDSDSEPLSKRICRKNSELNVAQNSNLEQNNLITNDSIVTEETEEVDSSNRENLNKELISNKSELSESSRSKSNEQEENSDNSK